jgi:hypothetical protein
MDTKTEEKINILIEFLAANKSLRDQATKHIREIEEELIGLMPGPEEGTTRKDIYNRRILVMRKMDYRFIGLDDMDHDEIMEKLPTRVKYEVVVKDAKAILAHGSDVAKSVLQKHLSCKPTKPSVKIEELKERKTI